MVERFPFEVLHSEGAGGVALRVEIDEQNALGAFRQRSAEIYRRRCFANASLLICDGNDFHPRRSTNILSVGPAGVSPADLLARSLIKAVRQNAGLGKQDACAPHFLSDGEIFTELSRNDQRAQLERAAAIGFLPPKVVGRG